MSANVKPTVAPLPTTCPCCRGSGSVVAPPIPLSIAEAGRLEILAGHIRSRLKPGTDGGVTVFGRDGLGLDIAAARNALDTIERLT